MAKRRHTRAADCPSCGQGVAKHEHRVGTRSVYLCDDCEAFAPYVLAAMVDDLHAEAEQGVAAEWYAITADDHDAASWTRAA